MVWKNSRSIFGLTNYFAGQPRVAGAILSILFGLFLSACGGGAGSSGPNPDTFPIFVDAPVQGLHYQPVGPRADIPPSQETGGRGGFNPSYRQLNFGTIAFAVGTITVAGDGLTLSQYKSNGFLGFIVHPADEWQNVVFTPYDLRNAKNDNEVSAGTVNVGAVARVLQGFDETPPTFNGDNIDDDLILIHPGATAGRTVIFAPTPAGDFSINGDSVVAADGGFNITISLTVQYAAATLTFPGYGVAMDRLNTVISMMVNEIAPFIANSTITINNENARTRPYFTRRDSYSLVASNVDNEITIDSHTGSISVAVTSGDAPTAVVQFRYGQISITQVVELNARPALKTKTTMAGDGSFNSQPFQIYFTGGKRVSLNLEEAKGGNLPLRYELTSTPDLSEYGFSFDESGLLTGTPRQSAFMANVTLDVFDSGGDEADSLGPDLEFQIVSREGEPAHYEIDLTGGAGSIGTLIFEDLDGNGPHKSITENNIAKIYSGCQKNGAPDFKPPDCPYIAGYAFGGADHDGGRGDILGVMVTVGLRSTMMGGITVCVGGECPAGVEIFTISFQRDSSVAVRVLLPRPAFFGSLDSAFASEIFTTYIQDSPSPMTRPLPAADGGRGRLVYSLGPTVGLDGLDFNAATRRFSGGPTMTMDMSYPLTMTVTDLNGEGKFATYLFTIKTEKDRKPMFASAEFTITATLFDERTNIPLPTITAEVNREATYSVIGALPLHMVVEDGKLSGPPAKVGDVTIYYIATDPDEERDEDGNLHTADDDTATLKIIISVDGIPSFGETVPTQRYILNSQIATLTLPAADGGNGSLTYTQTGLTMGIDFDVTTRQLSGTPTVIGSFVATIVVSDDDNNRDESDRGTLFLTIVVEDDIKPVFATDAVTAFVANLNDDTNLTLPAIINTINRATMYSVSALLQGMEFNETTRQLRGRPRKAGSFTFDYVATDLDGHTDEDDDKATLTIVIFVDDAPVFDSREVSAQRYILDSQIATLTLPRVTGDGNDPLTYTDTGLPNGITLVDNNPPELIGAPTVTGSFVATVVVSDTDSTTENESDTLTFSIEVEDDFMPMFENNAETVTVSLGVPTTYIFPTITNMINRATVYSVDVMMSTIPPGMMTVVSAMWELRGIPNTVGSFTIYYIATDPDEAHTDADDDTDTLTIVVFVDGEPEFDPPSVSSQTYTVGIEITSLTLPVAIDGNEPLMYSVNGLEGSELTFNNDNPPTISGTPSTAVTSYDVTYMVEDRDGDTSSLTFTITVNAPPPPP